jgi:hypothetical protein
MKPGYITLPLDAQMVVLLERIAEALDRAYPKVSVPPVGLLFDDPKADPVNFVIETWGETRADAEAIVATTVPQESDEENPPGYRRYPQ